MDSELSSDRWTGSVFGRLTVIGYYKVNIHRKYLVRCSICLKDPELNGEAIFPIMMSSLKKGGLPCNCSNRRKKTQEEYTVLLNRACKNKGYEFLGYLEPFRGNLTKISVKSDYGLWESKVSYILQGKSSMIERAHLTSKTSSIDENQALDLFSSLEYYPENTIFKKSDTPNSFGYKTLWDVSCGACGESFTTTYWQVSQGRLSCNCSWKGQKFCYICLITDMSHTDVALKFGVSNNVKTRVVQHNYSKNFNFKLLGVWEFQTRSECKKAEHDCHLEISTLVLSKSDLPKGYTETAYLCDYDKIVRVFERNNGIKMEVK